MTAWVIDASVALKWHLSQNDSDSARRILTADAALHAPVFQFLEVTHIIAKYARLKLIGELVAREAANAHGNLITVWHEDSPLIAPAFAIAMGHAHAVYDCLYLALALRINSRVITADGAFAARFTAGEHAGRVTLLSDFAAAF